MSRETDYLEARIARLEAQLEQAHLQIGYWRASAIGVAKSLAWSREDERTLNATLNSARRTA